MRSFFLALVLALLLYFHPSQSLATGSCSWSDPAPPGGTYLCSNCSGGVNGTGGSCGIPNYTNTFQNAGYCSACEGIDTQGRYLYRRYLSDGTIDSSSCGYFATAENLVAFVNPQNSNVNTGGCYWALLPSGCNNGFGTENCSAGGGGGGQCGVNADPNPPCPEAYQGRDCSVVACGQRNNCSCPCTCDGSCQESPGGNCSELPGGGPTATPTPTPTPYCTLSCPGSSGSGGSGTGLGGGSGVGAGGSTGDTTIIPPYASGSLSYAGYNGFACSTFDNGTTGVGSCPTSSGGAGGESWSQAATFNMLCGEQPQTYTAEVVGNGSGGGTGAGGSSGGIGAGATSTPAPGTPTPTPTLGLYPQGCSLGSGGTITPTRAGGTGAGGTGASGLSCSCSVTLGCQTSLEAPASDPSQESGSCTPGVCDFTVSPDFAAFNSELSFTIDHADQMNQNSIDYSDQSAAVDLGAGTSTTHTFVNAGVYPVTLTCSNGSSNISCTRKVNAYCNNGLVPTATPTPAATTSWFKLKNTSFSRESAVTNTIPSTATAFDSDDSGICATGQPAVKACLISGVAGSVLSEGALSLGDGTSSSRGWQKQNTVLVKRFTPTSFRDYALARKKTNTITSISEIQAGKINKYSGNLTVSNSDFAGLSDDFVLLVDGDLTIMDSLTNTTNIAAAFIVTGNLKLATTVGELNGIFVTTNVDFAYDTTPSDTPLKIVGNLVSINPGDTTKRVRVDTDKPSIFVSGDSTKYTRIIGLLGINTYDQQEIAQ